MVPLAVLDILADDWVRSRQDSARAFGTRPSNVVRWWAAIRALFDRPRQPAAVLSPTSHTTSRTA